MEEEKMPKKSKFDKRLLIYGIIVIAVVAAGAWLWQKYGKNSNEAGAVQGVKTSEQQAEQPKTVPESKYFSADAKIMIFYSDTCSWCQKQKEILGELGYEGYRFKPMNVGKDQRLWQQYEISGTPTFVAPNGDKLIGYREKAELKVWMDKHLK